MLIHRVKMATLALVPIAVVGCASTETNPALEEARIAVQAAGNDPQVLAAAQVELNRARQSLNSAQALYEESGNKERTSVEHDAYLAKRYAQIAVARAATEEAQAEIDSAEAERNRVLLQERTSEAERSERQAQAALAEANRNRALLQERTSEAERSEREAQAALEEARELERQLAELQAEQTERGLVLTLGDVLFDTNQATLKAGATNTLDQLATFMNEYPERNVLIEGHTDSTGADEYNRMLSERRANAVRDELLSRGIGIGRIHTLGVGEDAPVATNDTAAGRQQNRRVEVLISDDEGRIASLRQPTRDQ